MDLDQPDLGRPQPSHALDGHGLNAVSDISVNKLGSAFDRAIARQMLETLIKPYSSGQIEIVGFPVARGGPILPRHFAVTEIDAMVDHAARINARTGVGAYVGAARREGAPLERRARGDHVAGTYWVWADFDAEGAAETAEATLAKAGIPPTFWVTTGSQPWLRRQGWWQLSHEIPGDRANAIMGGMIEPLGADPSPKNPDRVMRLAGSIAWAKPDKPGRADELVSMAMTTDPIGYHPEQLESAFAGQPSGGGDPGTSEFDFGDIRQDVFSALRDNPNNTNEADWSRIGRALKFHIGDEALPHFVAFSRKWTLGPYINGEAEKKWASQKPDGSIGLATVFQIVGQPARSAGTKAKKETQDAATTCHRDLKLRHFDDDLEPVLDTPFLIEDVLPSEGFAVAYGAPGCGKTFVALDLAFAVSGASKLWRDKRVEHGAVLYFGMEGGALFGNRIAAYAREFGRAPYFYRSAEQLDLRSTDADADAIVKECRRIAKAGHPVKLIVVDTLNRAMSGGNENASEDMGAFIRIVDSIRKEVGCVALVIHHSGKDDTRGSRGHSSLLGAVDTELHLSDGVLKVTKQRDGQDGLKFGYELRSVVLGTDQYGKEVTSCVIDEAGVSKPKEKLSGNQQRALEALQEFVLSHGQPCPAGQGWPEAGTKRIVPLDTFREVLAGKQTSDVPKRRNESAKRQIDQLLDKGFIQINEGHLWIV